MDKETKDKIRWWEAERDRNLRIRCTLVAAKFQRYINKELKSEKESKDEYRYSKESNKQT